jgi:hypothetical protein
LKSVAQNSASTFQLQRQEEGYSLMKHYSLTPFCRILLLALALVSTLVGQDTTGVGLISGTVQDAAGAPVPNTRVCIAKTDRCATSDGSGSFRISDLRAGTYRLEVGPQAKPFLSTESVEVRAGLEGRVNINLPKIDSLQQSLTVNESAFLAPEEVKTSGFIIQRDEIFKSAGTLQDVSRYVQSLPGVAIGSNDLRNDIIVRGGSPLENLFVVDNIELPNINSFANFASAGGTVSILDAAVIQDVTFLSGGYPAPFTNRTSGVLQVAQREGDRQRRQGRATLGFAGVGALFEGPVNKGKGSWLSSARRSFLDVFTDDVGFGGVPVFYSFTNKFVYDLTPRDRIWAVSITGIDDIRLGARENPEEQEEVNNVDIRYDGWRSGNGFNWQRLFGSTGVGLLGITHSEARVNARVRDLLRGGLPPAGLSVEQQIARAPEVFRENSREGETTIKYDSTWNLPFIQKLQVGGSFKIFNNRYKTASPFGVDSPYSLQRDLNPFDIAQSFTAYQSGVYIQSTQNLTKRLNLTWGGRIDNYRYLGATRFSPRLGLSYRITNKLSARASYGQYYQQPFFLFLTVFPTNRGLIPFRADHIVWGLSYIADSTLRFTAEAYTKEYKDYPVAQQFPTLSLANVGDTFAVRNILFPLVSAGRGRSMGVELFVEKKFSAKWFGQANVSFSKVEYGGLDGVLRAGSFDYQRILNVIGGYRLTSKWELSTRYSYLGGRPFTPFNTAASTAQGRGIFDLNRINAERLPAYSRLDFRADRTFTVRDKPLLVFIGVQNLLNRKNVAGFGWNRSQNALETSDQLGLFPLIGMEWRF